MADDQQFSTFMVQFAQKVSPQVLEKAKLSPQTNEKHKEVYKASWGLLKQAALVCVTVCTDDAAAMCVFPVYVVFYYL